MIVISGALVLVALVLLIFGITTTDLDFVYASILVSLVSFVFLLVGILQRRGERGSDVAPAGDRGGQEQPALDRSPDEGVTAVIPRTREHAARSAPVREPEPATEELAVGDELVDEPSSAGTVLVVPGRPRYHVAGCRYLSGKSASEVDVADARDEGFSPCGVCKPDDALAAAAPEPEPEPVAAAAPVRRPRSSSGAGKAPAKRSPRAARPEPSPAATAAAAEPATDPVLEAVAADQPAAGAAAAEPAAAAAAVAEASSAAAPGSRRRSSNVVVIPDRGKFHRAECRYVRNADETSTMSKTQATRQGYDACGVCKP